MGGGGEKNRNREKGEEAKKGNHRRSPRSKRSERSYVRAPKSHNSLHRITPLKEPPSDVSDVEILEPFNSFTDPIIFMFAETIEKTEGILALKGLSISVEI